MLHEKRQVSRNAQLSKSQFLLDIHFVDTLEEDQMKGAAPGKRLLAGSGFAAVIMACFTSGFAGVWTQKMLQQSSASAPRT